MARNQYKEFRIKVFGPALYQRREIPRGTLASVDWSDEDDGGYGELSVETFMPVAALGNIQTGDIVELYVKSEGVWEQRYRGKITRRAITGEDTHTLTLKGESEGAEIGRTMLDRQFLLPKPCDVGTLWRAVATEAKTISGRTDLEIIAERIGLEKNNYEAQWVKFGEASRDIVQAGGNLVGWGIRRQRVAPYKLTCALNRKAQPYDPPIGHIVIGLPQRDVPQSEGEDDATDIRNILYIKGGVPANPNRVPNADFRLQQFAGETFRVLLHSNSFEELANWTLLGGSAYKKSGSGLGDAHSGSVMLECDHSGEGAEQIRLDIAQYLVPGHTYRAEAYARRTTGAGVDSQLTLELTWLEVDGTTEIPGQVQTYSLTDAEWNVYGFSVQCPASGLATGFRFKVTSADTASIVIDDVNMYDTSLIVPQFHELRLYGDATAEVVNYAQTAVRHPYRSAYAPEFAIRGLDADNRDAQFGLLDALNGGDGGETVTFDITKNQTYRICCDVISPRTPSGAPYKQGRMLIGIHWRKADGSAVGSSAQLLIPATDGITEWTQFTFTATPPSEAAKALVLLNFRGGCSYTDGELTALGIPATERGLARLIVGGWSVRLAGAQPEVPNSMRYGLPDEPAPQYEWIPDGPYKIVLKPTDVLAPGVPERDSIATYGPHPYTESNDGIIELEQAKVFATAYFLAYGAVIPSGSITRQGDTRYYTACQGIVLRGKQGRIYSSLVVALRKVTYKFDGEMSVNFAWGKTTDDPYDVLESLLQSMQQAGGQGAGGGYYGSSGSTAGGGVYSSTPVTAMYWGTSPRSSSDTTLHDDYLPVDGPHVTPAERIAWNAAAAGSGTIYVPMTNGDTANPEIMFNADGSVLLARITL